MRGYNPGTWDDEKPVVRVSRTVTSEEYTFAVSWMAHHRKQPAVSGPGFGWRCYTTQTAKAGPELPEHIPPWLYHSLPWPWNPDIQTATQALAIALADIRESLTLPQ